uniref:Uncharacterized protein n=1 Tax=Ficedula albicollis TaxID=59894 RepID=A0A803VUZ4_FICAL
MGLPSASRVVARDEEDEEEKIFPADSPVLLRELNNKSHYSGWVQASNALGTARSAPRLLSLQELVVPALPVAIGAHTSESSPPVTTTRWRSRTRLQNVRCQERHRATGTPTWQVEPCDTAAQEGPRRQRELQRAKPCDTAAQEGPRWQRELQSDTEFEFQARCRLGSAQSPWSAWSPPFFYRTPEAGALSRGRTASGVGQPRGARSPAEVALGDTGQCWAMAGLDVLRGFFPAVQIPPSLAAFLLPRGGKNRISRGVATNLCHPEPAPPICAAVTWG